MPGVSKFSAVIPVGKWPRPHSEIIKPKSSARQGSILILSVMRWVEPVERCTVTCKIYILLNFVNVQGFLKTEKGHYGGGDTAWEEENNKVYKNSELRLVEIQEGLCTDLSAGQDQVCATIYFLMQGLLLSIAWVLTDLMICENIYCTSYTVLWVSDWERASLGGLVEYTSKKWRRRSGYLSLY